MNLIAIIAMVSLSSFGAGYYTSSLNYTKVIASYETEIKLQNKQASELLTQLEEEKNANEIKQIESNTQLDLINESNLKTINTYHTELSSIRLSKSSTSRASYSCPKAGNSSTKGTVRVSGVPSQVKCELSDDFEKLLKEESFRADRIRVGAELCSNFINNLPNLKEEMPNATNP